MSLAFLYKGIQRIVVVYSPVKGPITCVRRGGRKSPFAWRNTTETTEKYCTLTQTK